MFREERLVSGQRLYDLSLSPRPRQPVYHVRSMRPLCYRVRSRILVRVQNRLRRIWQHLLVPVRRVGHIVGGCILDRLGRSVIEISIGLIGPSRRLDMPRSFETSTPRLIEEEQGLRRRGSRVRRNYLCHRDRSGATGHIVETGRGLMPTTMGFEFLRQYQ